MLFKCSLIWEWSAFVRFTDFLIDKFLLMSEQAEVVDLIFFFALLFFLL